MKLEIYYSVHNCGDGSAYPHFFNSEELAEIDQEIQTEISGEGWGESCTGSITIEGNNISCVDMTTAKKYLEELLDDYDEEELNKKEMKKLIAQVKKLAAKEN